MKTYLFIKPESVHSLTDIKMIVAGEATNLSDEVDEATRSFYQTVDSGLDVLMGIDAEHTDGSLVFVRSGILSEEMFGKVYPSSPQGEAGLSLKGRLVGSPYFLIGMDLPLFDEKTGPAKLSDLKGKFFSEESPEGYGLRGKLRKEYLAKGVEEVTTGINFVHMPDSGEEASLLFEYLNDLGTDEEGKTLYGGETVSAFSVERSLV